MVSTLYIIFEDDIKRAALPPAADLTLEIGATLITVFFIVDMGKWAKQDAISTRDCSEERIERRNEGRPVVL